MFLSRRVAGAVASAVVILSIAVGPGVMAGQKSPAAQVDSAGAESLFQQAIDLELNRQWQLALDAARQAAALDPATAKYIDKEARLAGFLMLDELAAGNRAGADAYAGELLALEVAWQNGPAKLDAATELRFGQAHFLAGDLNGAERLLHHAAKTGLLNSEAEVWLYALYEHQDNTKAMERLVNQPWLRYRAFNPVYMAIKP